MVGGLAHVFGKRDWKKIDHGQPVRGAHTTSSARVDSLQ